MNYFPKSICILRLSALGDCINAFGLVSAIRKQYPEVELTFVVDKRFSSLFKKDDGSFIVPTIAVDIKKDGLFKACMFVRNELKHKRFDALYNLQTSLKASLISLFIKADKKFGYDAQRRREGQLLFINHQVKSPENPHVLAGFMAFAHETGFENLKPNWDFCLSDYEIAQADELLPNCNKIFCIAPASAKKVKNWTVDGYSVLAQYAIKKGFNVVLLGSNNPLELDLCNQIEQRINHNCTNLCGKTNLRVLAAVIKQAKLVLSPDSAAMHLSSAQNVPVIGLFAIHNPDRVGSWNYRNLEVSVYQKLAKKELAGEATNWRYRVKIEDGMKEITVESVKEAFDKAVTTYNL